MNISKFLKNKIFWTAVFSLMILPCLLAQSAEDILEKSAQAQLQGTNINDIYSVYMKGQMTMPGGILGEFEIYRKEGGKSLQKTSIPSINVEITMGCDGTDCYQLDPMLGPRLLTGQELANSLLEANFQSEFKWQETYTSYKFMGEELIDKRPCYKLELVTKAGLELTNYYDKDTYLLYRTDTIVENETFGKVAGKIYYENYQDFQGILMPTLMIMEMISNRIEMHQTDFQFNQKMDDSIFDIPAAVRPSQPVGAK